MRIQYSKIKEGGKIMKKYKNKMNLIAHRKKVHGQGQNLKQSKTSKDIRKS
jgi:predicted DNA-binding protein YlxM (UPF0122 family)